LALLERFSDNKSEFAAEMIDIEVGGDEFAFSDNFCHATVDLMPEVP